MSAFLLWNSGISVQRFDVVTSEVQERTNLITEHPVESGANVADHIRPNLNKVTLEVFVSNSPLNAAEQLLTPQPLDVPQAPANSLYGAAIEAIGSLFVPDRPIVAQVLTFPVGAPDFVAQLILTLEDLRSQGTLIQVVCPHATYDSMVLESFEVHRDSNTGDSATFELSFREIRIVSSSLTGAPEPTVKRTAPKQDKGDQAAKTPEPQNDSLLTKLLDGAGLGLN